MSTASPFDVLLEISCECGNVTLDERAQEPAGGDKKPFYESIHLLNCDLPAGINPPAFTVSIDEDTPEGKVSFQIAGYHMKDPTSGRVFHACLDLHLERRDARRVRDFLSLLLIEES